MLGERETTGRADADLPAEELVLVLGRNHFLVLVIVVVLFEVACVVLPVDLRDHRHRNLPEENEKTTATVRPQTNGRENARVMETPRLVVVAHFFRAAFQSTDAKYG